MAANTTPIFTLTPKSPGARLSVANTNRDGSTGTYVTVYTAGSSGSRFSGLRWIAEGNSAAGAIRMFVQDGGSGNVELVYEGIVPATTFSAGVTPVASGGYFPMEGIILSASSVVKCNTHASEPFGVFLVGGGDY